MGSTSIVPVITDATPIEALLCPFNERIRPLLDAVDRLRSLKVTKEGIQLPTIVVVGDQSSGKSSVLESLAAISLPRGQGICTRVPLILSLQAGSPASLTLEYAGKSVQTDDSMVAAAIDEATRELAGDSKGISNTPLTLIVRKPGVPDLTMVDLPGITRVAVHGQPENIYEQVRDIIMEYIAPEESIILNVISASVDFSTSESIRMSQMVDKTGQRTLAVVTKSDKSPEGLLEKVTADDVSIGLGYVCVRNRIGDESFLEARAAESELFDSHPMLSRIDKSIVGIPNLARKLVQIQTSIIAKCLPNIIRQINDKLNANVTDLNQMPRNFSSVADAMTAFMGILGSAKDSLRKILITGEFDEFPDEAKMHCTARLAELMDGYSNKLQQTSGSSAIEGLFLMEEVMVLEDSKGIWLPNFLPRSVFLTFLHRKVRGIHPTPDVFVDEVWDYLEEVVLKVMMHHSANYPQLHSMMRRAAESVVSKMKKVGMERMWEMLETEKRADYTCNPEYMSTWNQLMGHQKQFTEIVEDTAEEESVLKIDGFWEVDVAHIRAHKDVAQQAFDMKMRVTAYWKVVLRRVVDSVALHLLYSVQNLVNKELEAAVVEELLRPGGGGIERMLEESPSVANKREKLTRSVELLKESKHVLARIMDFID
ncbi:hypothetical protein V2J09_020353 [Rumex salicifolius]